MQHRKAAICCAPASAPAMVAPKLQQHPRLQAGLTYLSTRHLDSKRRRQHKGRLSMVIVTCANRLCCAAQEHAWGAITQQDTLWRFSDLSGLDCFVHKPEKGSLTTLLPVTKGLGRVFKGSSDV